MVIIKKGIWFLYDFYISIYNIENTDIEIILEFFLKILSIYLKYFLRHEK